MSSRIDDLEKEVNRLVIQVYFESSQYQVEEGCGRAGEEGERRGKERIINTCLYETRVPEHE